MLGMDRVTGRALAGEAHLVQSITDLLSTPKATRIMLRDYGFDFDVIDAPLNPVTIIEIYAGVAEVIRRWEPRLSLKQVTLNEASAAGRASLTLLAERTDEAAPDGQPQAVTLVIPLRPPNDKEPS